MRATLVVAEIALAAVLVVGATSLVRALVERSGADLGFDPSGLVVLRVAPPQTRYGTAASSLALYDRLREATARVPGVARVELVNHLPLSGTSMPTDVRTSRAPNPGERPAALYRAVSDGYFDALDVSLVEGRFPAPDQVAARAPVAVVNEALARREWPGESAVGQSLTVHRVAQGRPDFGEEMTLTVIGVVADTRSFGPDSPEPPVVYAPYTLAVWTSIFLVVEPGPRRPAANLLDGVRSAIHGVDPDIPVAGPGFTNRVRPMEDYAANLLQARRLNTTLLGGFAAAALLLATVGLFGVIAYHVAQRRREFGVRVALGASVGGIVRLVVGQGIRLAGIGLVLGFAGALALGRALAASQPDLAATRMASFAAAGALFLGAALVACVAPALRAARTAPARILREEG